MLNPIPACVCFTPLRCSTLFVSLFGYRWLQFQRHANAPKPRSESDRKNKKVRFTFSSQRPRPPSFTAPIKYIKSHKSALIICQTGPKTSPSSRLFFCATQQGNGADPSGSEGLSASQEATESEARLTHTHIIILKNR